MDPAPGVPVPSCPPPEPFLCSRGVGAGVESRSFGLLYGKKEKKRKSFKTCKLSEILDIAFTTSPSAECFLL